MNSNPFYGAHHLGYKYSKEPSKNGITLSPESVQSDCAYSRLQRDRTHSMATTPTISVKDSPTARTVVPAAPRSMDACSSHTGVETGKGPSRGLSLAWMGRRSHDYATPMVGQSHTPTPDDIVPAPYLTPSLRSANVRGPTHLVQPPQYEDVKGISTEMQQVDVGFGRDPSTCTPQPSHQVPTCSDVQPYATTKNSEIPLVSETEV